MRRERALLVLIVVAFVASVAVTIAQHVPFEYDESAYATQARAWAAGGPVTGIRLQRAPLLPAIGTLLYKAGARSEWPFRLTGLAFGVAVVVLVWALARAIAGPIAGLIAAALLASAPTVMQRSAQFMTDIPATAFLLAMTVVLWHNRERAGPSLLLVAPLAAGAFYMRYASVLPVALVVLTASVVWRDGLLRDRRLVGATVVLFAALMAPHVVRAVHATGRPWGLVTYTARFAGRKYVGEGLLAYLRWLPFALAGPVAGIAMIAGIVMATARRTRAAAFLISPALADVVLLGLTEHGDKRFIFFPVALLCVAGAIAVAGNVQQQRALATILAIAVLAGAAFTVHHNEQSRAKRIPPALAGRVVDAQTHAPCSVLAVEIAETTWYTGCSTYDFSARAPFAVLYRVGGARLTGQPAEPPPGAVKIATLRDRGRRYGAVYALPGP